MNIFNRKLKTIEVVATGHFADGVPLEPFTDEEVDEIMGGDRQREKYQVEYEGQVITQPLTFKEAHQIAADENYDAVLCGHLPLAEVTLAERWWR